MLEYSFMACKRKGELDNIRSPADPPVEKEVPEDIRRQSTYAQQGGVGAGISGELVERAHRHTNLPFLFLSHLFLQPPPPCSIPSISVLFSIHLYPCLHFSISLFTSLVSTFFCLLPPSLCLYLPPLSPFAGVAQQDN